MMQRAVAPTSFGHQGHRPQPLRNAQGMPFPSRPFNARFLSPMDMQTTEPNHDSRNNANPREEVKKPQGMSRWNAAAREEVKQPEHMSGSNTALPNRFTQQRQQNFNRRKGFGGRPAAPTSKFAIGGFEDAKEDQDQQSEVSEEKPIEGTGAFSSTSHLERNQSFQFSQQEVKPSGGFQKPAGWSTDQSSLSTHQSFQKMSKNIKRRVRPLPATTSKIGGFENDKVEEEHKSWAEFMGEKRQDATSVSTVHELFSNSTEIELAVQYEEEELLKATSDDKTVSVPIRPHAEQKTEVSPGETMEEYIPEKEDSRDSVWRAVKEPKTARNGAQSYPIKSISSDESEYSDHGEDWAEANPMGSGWRLGIFLDILLMKDIEGAQVEVWVAGEGMVKMNINLDTADKVKSAYYLRFLPPANPDDFVKMMPSKHYTSRASMVKVRPGRALEVRTTAVVAYSKACDIQRVPVWCDPIGWLELDFSRFGVLRKGTEKNAAWSWFRPLKIIEMTVRVRLDVPFENLEYVKDGIVVSDIVRILHVDKKENELPNKLFPMVPRRHHDLRLLELEPDSPNKVQFKSRAYPEYTIFSERDQFAYEDEMEMKHLDMTAILVPVNKKEDLYRAVIVGPAQVLQTQTKDRIFDYRRAPVRRHYMPKDEACIERFKRDGLRLDQQFKRMELKKMFDLLPI